MAPVCRRFVFFRDPAQRLLSAWLDKFGPKSPYGQTYGLRVFKRVNISFPEFVNLITARVAPNALGDGLRVGLHPFTNPHWRPQRYVCNLERYLGAYDFVGSFAQLENHTRLLLERKGLWEKFGATGWTKLPPSLIRHKGNPRWMPTETRLPPQDNSPGTSIFARNAVRQQEAAPPS